MLDKCNILTHFDIVYSESYQKLCNYARSRVSLCIFLKILNLIIQAKEYLRYYIYMRTI